MNVELRIENGKSSGFPIILFEKTNPFCDSKLKKQSQFVPDIMGVTPFMEGGYGIIPAGRFDENKANPPGLSIPTRNRRTSQDQFDAPFSAERSGEKR